MVPIGVIKPWREKNRFKKWGKSPILKEQAEDEEQTEMMEQ